MITWAARTSKSSGFRCCCCCWMIRELRCWSRIGGVDGFRSSRREGTGSICPGGGGRGRCGGGPGGVELPSPETRRWGSGGLDGGPGSGTSSLRLLRRSFRSGACAPPPWAPIKGMAAGARPPLAAAWAAACWAAAMALFCSWMTWNKCFKIQNLIK